MASLPEPVLELLRRPSICFLSTVMPDGSPQITQVWVDTDGEHVVVNTVQGFQKVRNMERDPRVAVALADPDNSSRYVQIRGTVRAIRAEGGVEHIEQLAQKYLGGPYPWWGGRDQVRLIVEIEPDRVSGVY